ncbi:MAG: DUF4912 domain-containing protein [Tildeniella nuda ZEHNDER 1965/U140]|jgi:phosphate transport system substrate-binding protein|nr:DUF4912 domain-containing protein [Tildeniella nuda ZEHNDER 1965/U140]
MKSRTKEASIASVALLLALVSSAPLAASLNIRPVLAQASPTGLPLPTAVPSGTTIGIDGSSSMATINQALKQRFEQQFPGTDVKLGSSGTAAALQAVLSGKLDLAAIGRSLTAAEKAQGLIATPLSRRKIAIVIGSANPFKGNLTLEQFAKIFRGEITNWSQVGGAPGAIRVVDRPDTSDTRQSFQNYPVFKQAPFKVAPGAVKLTEDSTDAVIKALGTTGIGYAIVDQVTDKAGATIVPMHNTLPTDPRYPFSQPLGYAYKGPEPNPGAQAFLGYATAPESQQTVETAKTETIAPSTAPSAIAPSPEATTPSPVAAPAQTTGFPWWLLLALPLLGGLLWWLLKGRGAPAGVVAAAKADPSRLILTPRTCKDAYAYWEVPDAAKADLRRQGGEKLALRVYDVTDIDLNHHQAHSVQQFDCHADQQDLHVPIPVDNRDYLAELGYVTGDDRWLSLAKSDHVRVPACPPVGTEAPDRMGTVFKTGAAVAGVAGAAVAAKSFASDRAQGSYLDPDDQNRLILVPRNDDDAYAYWEVSDAAKESLRRQGGETLTLRLHDVTGGIDLDQQSPHSTKQINVDELAQDRHIPLATLRHESQGNTFGQRDYVAELGYATGTDRWLTLARSAPVQLPVSSSPSNLVGESVKAGSAAVSDGLGTALKMGGAAVAGAAATAAGAWTSARAALDHGATSHPVSTEKGSRIILVPRSAKQAYAYWEVSQADKDDRKRQGGETQVLRVYEVTGMDMDSVPAHSVQSFECRESDQDRHVPIPVSDRDYVAEIGYTTKDGRWLSIIRSFHVRVPAV